ncbi:ATP-grasp ribosomal peptide maturase [Amycolatopsis minnesotensis]|uniref:ATP-grasp ribosomal peptide maturase n=1 Tax=Amycolatopsis minnesotensis TaxID=337894 RepID=A0ABN2QXY8_9PSEU
MTVLVLTAPDDDTATRVCQALDDRGCAHARMDLGDFPKTLSCTATGPDWTGWLSDGHRELRLSEIRSVYYRRPSGFRFPAHLPAQERRFAAAEARQGLGGLLFCLRVPFVNHPSRIADAELKPAQLQAAADVGFRVPRTLITNDAEEARAFAHETDGRILYKPLTAAFLRTDEVKLVYATLVRADDLDDDAIALSPCQFQAFVPKRHDVRLTAVGRECFATIIHAGSEESYWDWRADYPSLRYEPVAPPDAVAASVTAYLHRFGLVFGCFDFTVDTAGDWWFLECGANAQWGWIEYETGLPIAEAIARQLTGGTT